MSIRRRHEAVLKTLVVLVAVLLAAAPAVADVLVVGAVRDQDGRAVSGALVVARDGAGTVVGRDATSPDGTFAVDASAQPAALTIDGAYLAPRRLAVVPGQPVAAIVTRYGAVADRVPSPADLAALPAGSTGALASAIPFVLAPDGVLSDRGLGGGHGGVAVDGIGFYRRSDGGDVSALVPRHAIGALAVADPLDAPRYGDRAAGGVFDADAIAGTDAARAFGDDASLRFGRTLAATVANDRTDGLARVLTAARFDDGALRVDWLALRSDVARADGAALRWQRYGPGLDGSASVALDAQSTPGALRFDGSSLALAAAVRTHGAMPWEAGVRARDERGAAGVIAGTSDEAAFYVASERRTDADALRVELAAERDRAQSWGVAQRTTALLPSLSYERRLADRWDLHLGAGASMRAPTYVALAVATPVTRTALDEAALAYDDRRRVRVELAAWRERATSALVSTLSGAGIDAAWQIAPRVSLRAWMLRNDAATAATSAAAYGYLEAFPYALGSRTQRSSFVWLSWTAPTRVDVVERAGALEAAIRAPLARHLAASVATYRRENGARVTDLGLVFSP